jgi:purine-nucleoside phosphorylase
MKNAKNKSFFKEWFLISSGNLEIFPDVRPVGIGLIESAIKLSHIISLKEKKVKGIIFIGTIGSYGNLSIGTEVYSYSAYQIESSKIEGKSYSPIQLKIENKKIKKYLPYFRELYKLPFIKINSSNYITTDFQIANLLRKKYKIDGESMEFYSILKISEYYNLPTLGYFVVTNYNNKFAHKKYLKNIEMAKKKINNFLYILRRI